MKRVESNQVRVVSDQVLAQPIVPGKSIDGIGFFCPIPTVKTRETLRTMAVVQILEMLSDDPGSEPDMKSWARKTGIELLEITQDGAVYRFLVRKVR